MSLIKHEPLGLLNHLQNQLDVFFPRGDTEFSSLSVAAKKLIGTERELHIEGDVPSPLSKKSAEASL